MSHRRRRRNKATRNIFGKTLTSLGTDGEYTPENGAGFVRIPVRQAVIRTLGGLGALGAQEWWS